MRGSAAVRQRGIGNLTLSNKGICIMEGVRHISLFKLLYIIIYNNYI